MFFQFSGGFDWLLDTYINMFFQENLYLQEILLLKIQNNENIVIIEDTVELMKKCEVQIDFHKGTIERLLNIIKQKEREIDLYLHILEENDIKIENLFELIKKY